MHPSKQDLVDAFAKFVDDRVNHGWSPFLLSFMFNQIPGSEAHRWRVMRKEIERVYAQLLPRFERNPNSPKRQGKLPIWIVAPDYPIHRRDKLVTQMLLPNDGHHGHVTALTLSDTRRGETLDDHLHKEQRHYAREPLFHIDAQPVTHRPGYVADYGLKAIASARVSYDDILILPRSITELSSYPSRAGMAPPRSRPPEAVGRGRKRVTH